MKQLIILMVFGSIAVAQAQTLEKTIQNAGVSTNVSILEYTARGYFEPYLTFGASNKQLLLATTILAGSNLGYQSPQSLRLSGGRIGYRFWPGSSNENWNFHVSVDMRLQRLKDLWNANLYNESKSDYQEYNLKTIELLLENHVGYGLVFNINEFCSISQGVGLGWYLSNLDVTAANTNAHLADIVDYRGYDDIGFLWNIRFEISYKLK